MAEQANVIISVNLPKELAGWLDKHMAEKRLAILSGNEPDRTLPTRSSFIRELITKAKNGSK